MKLAHSRLVESLGDRETSGPAPSRDNVAKQTEQKMAEGELGESCGKKFKKKTKHPNSVCVCAHVCVCLFAFKSEGYLLCSDPRF